MCVCCGLFVPTEFQFECCCVRDDSWWHMYIYNFFKNICERICICICICLCLCLCLCPCSVILKVVWVRTWKMVNEVWEGQTLVEARGDTDVQIVRWAKTNRPIQQLVSLKTAEDEQLHQVKRMIRGIGRVLFSTYSQTWNLQDPVVTFGEPLGHVITPCGQILVSRTDDEPPPPRRVSIQNVPVCTFKTSPCVPAPRAHVETHVRVMPATRGRFGWTYGVFTVPHTNHTTHHTAHTPQHKTWHNTSTRPQHHMERERETERDRERRRGQREKREDGRGETREERTEEDNKTR